MITTTVDTTDLDRLNDALGRCAALGRRSPAEIVRRAAADIVLGSTGANGGPAFDGLFSELYKVAPERGEATKTAEQRGWRVDHASTSWSLGYAKAQQILGSEPSGVFAIARGPEGQLREPKRVYVKTRGKSAGTFYAHTWRARLAKTAKTAKGGGAMGAMGRGRVSSFYAKRGYSILNLWALATALAVSRREKGRGAAAAQFVPNRYRRLLLRKPGAAYGVVDGRMVKAESAMTQLHEKVTVTNAKGTARGSLEMDLGDSKASAQILGLAGVPTQFKDRVTRVVRAVTIDREAYLLRRAMKEAFRK